ncbi:TusE/DsrC/DsvC family sulfur relay protein [Halomonas garicola]|uniref:TusE/DsrC/DsvC family sulfur relay protein n=1 Tax=Halomonas garicola TaxID=1690008 RepID=UPI00289B9B76|nr:TusE/DsrC/DsvC family sulfur relay protein [Halomonas garicola]
MVEAKIYRYLECENKKIPLDPESYLVNMGDWTESVAEALAEEDGITLTKAHWELIWVLRNFYARFEMAPAMRAWIKAVKQQLGEEKGHSIYVMSLFPGSPAKRAARIAGLPKPTHCL